MIYTDRKFLSILALTEDRDYVTYDELIDVLTERPSGRVYIERNGVLCGLITAGRIKRRHDEKNRRVPFNKKFTCVHLGEHSRAWQFLGKICEVPVVSENERLLGDYTRWGDPIGTDYVELLLKNSYVLQSLKGKKQNVFLVKPVCEDTTRKEMFLWWRQSFESEGIHLQEIYHWEINDYLNLGKTFLFVDSDEKIGIKILYRYLYQQEIPKVYTIINYLNCVRQLANLSFIQELQNQGVFVLATVVRETSNHFLSKLNQRIKRRAEDFQVDISALLPEELKESFAGELYCEAYQTQKFPLPVSCETRAGILYFGDEETEFLHIQNGERLTVNQPERYDRCIYFYGNCFFTGLYVPDKYTIPSLLQDDINQAGFSCKVVNRGFMESTRGSASADRLQSAKFKKGDIVVIEYKVWQAENCPELNMIDELEKHDAPVDWFVDAYAHCNHKANQIYAHAIYKELFPILQQPTGERIPIKLDHDYIDRFYLRHYFSDFDPTRYETVGSIVMNCNPFTLGHRFLIEEALKTVDFLIIFVVEEEESVFSFQERFAMVCQGTNDLDRVMVVPSGPYILSKTTFPEYFQKINDEDLQKNTESDITLFAEKIAPKLCITHRFVGEEREDKVTNEYNEAMKRILPHYGIQVLEIPRKTNGQSVISASRVRQCLSMNQMEELDELVPDSTKRILFHENKWFPIT